MKSTSHRNVLVSLVAALVLGVAQPAPGQTGPTGPQEAGASTPVAVEGVLTLRWAQPHGDGSLVASLTTDAGATYLLDVEQALAKAEGGLFALDRRRVEVTFDAGGGPVPAPAAPGEPPTVLAPTSVRAAATQPLPPSPPLSGSQRFVSILCRFSDSTGVTPREPSYFTNLLSSTPPGISDFWRQNSFSLIDNDASSVVGWFNLPHPRSHYVFEEGGRPGFSFGDLARDCTAAADSTVNFNHYVGINLMVNQKLDCCAWGGAEVLTLDGTNKAWPFTWMPPHGYNNQSVLGHEMGHAYGLRHSGSTYGNPYDSDWDVMSGGGICSPPHATFGCVGVHTIAHHKDTLGWIPAARKYTAAAPSDQTITIEDLAGTPAGATSYLMAQVPIGTSTMDFYTVEARKLVGYDQQVPAPAVVIHRVNTQRGRPAQVVDIDGDGDPNDAGAQWTPGETFEDTANGITVSVVSSDATGFRVRIQRTALVPVPNDSYPGADVTPPLPGQPRQFTVGTGAATMQLGEPSSVCSPAAPVGRSVWYHFTSPVSAPLTIDTGGSDYDTVLAVFTGGSVVGLTPVPGACNDDQQATTDARLVFTAAAGAHYYVQVAGYGGASGTLEIEFSGDFSGDAPRRPIADFDGDGDTDIAVFRPSNGTWLIEGQSPVSFGASGDIPVPADYDGDGRAEIAVYRPSTGAWFIQGQPTVFSGTSTDLPVPGDYDGDGRAEVAVFRPSVGAWIIGSDPAVFFGASGDIPVPADYDGDGDTDIAVFRPSVGAWYVPGKATVYSGASGDFPVPADFGDDGSADRGTWRPSVGGWYVPGQPTAYVGNDGDRPTPGDFDGDGGADIAVFRPSVGGWYVQGQSPVFFGASGDFPLALPAAVLVAHG